MRKYIIEAYLVNLLFEIFIVSKRREDGLFAIDSQYENSLFKHLASRAHVTHARYLTFEVDGKLQNDMFTPKVGFREVALFVCEYVKHEAHEVFSNFTGNEFSIRVTSVKHQVALFSVKKFKDMLAKRLKRIGIDLESVISDVESRAKGMYNTIQNIIHVLVKMEYVLEKRASRRAQNTKEVQHG